MQEQAFGCEHHTLPHETEDLLANIQPDSTEQQSLLIEHFGIQPAAGTNLGIDVCISQLHPDLHSMLLSNFLNNEKLVEQKILEATLRLQNAGNGFEPSSMAPIVEREKDKLHVLISMANQRNDDDDRLEITPAEFCEIMEYAIQVKSQTANQSNLNQGLQKINTEIPFSALKEQKKANQNESLLVDNPIESQAFGYCQEELVKPICLANNGQMSQLNNICEDNFYSVQGTAQRQEIVQKLDKFTKKSLPCNTEYSFNSDNFSAILRQMNSVTDIVAQEEERNDVVQQDLNGHVAQHFEEIKVQNKNLQHNMEIENGENLQQTLPYMSFDNNVSLQVNINSDSKFNTLEERKDISLTIQGNLNYYQQLAQENNFSNEYHSKEMNQGNQVSPNVNIKDLQQQKSKVSSFNAVSQYAQNQELQPKDMHTEINVQLNQNEEIIDDQLMTDNVPEISLDCQKLQPKEDYNILTTQNQLQIEDAKLDKSKCQAQIIPQSQKSSEVAFKEFIPTVIVDNRQHLVSAQAQVLERYTQVLERHTQVLERHTDDFAQIEFQSEYQSEYQPEVLQELENRQKHLENLSFNNLNISQHMEIQNHVINQKIDYNKASLIVEENPIHELRVTVPLLIQNEEKFGQKYFQDQTNKEKQTRQGYKVPQSLIILQQNENATNKQSSKDGNAQILEKNVYNNNPHQQTKQSEANVKSQRYSAFDFSQIPPCITININRDNEISLNIFNNSLRNSHFSDKIDKDDNKSSKLQSPALNDYNPRQLSLLQKGIQAVVDRVSISTQIQSLKNAKLSQDKLKMVQQITHQNSFAQEFHEIEMMADSYLLSNFLSQNDHKKFENMLRPHVDLKMTPQPKNEIGKQMFKNGLILVAVVKLITRSSKSPFLENYIYQYLQSAFSIQSNSYIFSKECNRAKESFQNYLQQRYQQNYNQIRLRQEKCLKRANIEESVQNKFLNQTQPKKLRLQSNSFSVSQQSCDKNLKTQRKVFCHQYTEMSNRLENHIAQRIENKKPSKAEKQKEKQQLKLAQSDSITQLKQARKNKAVDELKNEITQLISPVIQNEDKKLNQSSLKTNALEVEITNEGPKGEASKTKYADLKLTSQQKAQCIKQVQTCFQNKNSKFNQLYEKYKKIRENKKIQNTKPSGQGNGTPVPKSVLIDSRQKDPGAQRKKKHVQFLEQAVEMRKEEPELSPQEEGPSKMRKRKKTKKIENSTEETEQVLKVKKSTSKK